MSDQPTASNDQAPARDPLQEVALRLYVELCGHIYSGSAADKPHPKAVVELCFKLASMFEVGNLEFNPAARAARDAREKASVNLQNVQLDFAALGKPVPAP
jgi:hypothetical protein